MESGAGGAGWGLPPPQHACPGRFPQARAGQSPAPSMGPACPLLPCSPSTVTVGGIPVGDQGLGEQAKWGVRREMIVAERLFPSMNPRGSLSMAVPGRGAALPPYPKFPHQPGAGQKGC